MAPGTGAQLRVALMSVILEVVNPVGLVANCKRGRILTACKKMILHCSLPGLYNKYLLD